MILLSLMKVCCSCTASFGLAAEFGDYQVDLLAKHAFRHLWRDLLHQVVAAIDMLNGELHALELILTLHGIGPGAWHRRADVDRGAL